jgi:HPt (histidine-containing phosphotransfer) domain-containing protein
VTDTGGEALDRATYDGLLKMTGGDHEFVDELVDTYLADTIDQLAELDVAVVAGDAAALTRPAHSLKSSSLNVGALDLAGLARELEEQGRAGRVEGAPERVAVARRRFEAVRAALLARRAEDAAG